MMSHAKVVFLLYFVGIYLGSDASIQRDFSVPVVDTFTVLWNVPTFLCKKWTDFESTLKSYGFTVNVGDKFRGESMIILYDPGMFPAMLEDPKTKTLKERNGGIPQLGDLNVHISAFDAVFQKAVPADFKGVGVIDFEAWRPVFRQNWNDQKIYTNMSLDLERQRHPQWTEADIKKEAAKNFESAAKKFMHQTLIEAKKLRPGASWGYYGFPYCYNFGEKDQNPDCPKMVKDENDRIEWLFKESTGLHPSFYSRSTLTKTQHTTMVEKRMEEAWRLAVKVSRTKPPHIFPYLTFFHIDKHQFMDKDKMTEALEKIKEFKSGGAIMWASSDDVNSQQKCNDLMKYVHSIGPKVYELTHGKSFPQSLTVQGTLTTG